MAGPEGNTAEQGEARSETVAGSLPGDHARSHAWLARARARVRMHARGTAHAHEAHTCGRRERWYTHASNGVRFTCDEGACKWLPVFTMHPAPCHLPACLPALQTGKPKGRLRV